MAAIDHLVFVSPDPEAGVEAIAERSGVRAVPGGAHEGLGTRNWLVAFDDDTYLEIIGIDLDQPEPPAARPFGLDDAVGPHLATYAVHPTDGETIEDVISLLGSAQVEFAAARPMTRRRPDGTELAWRLAFPVGGGGVVPFVIDWGETPTPASSLPHVGVLESLEVAHPDPGVRAVLGRLDSRIESRAGGPSLSATIRSASGSFQLSGST